MRENPISKQPIIEIEFEKGLDGQRRASWPLFNLFRLGKVWQANHFIPKFWPQISCPHFKENFSWKNDLIFLHEIYASYKKNKLKKPKKLDLTGNRLVEFSSSVKFSNLNLSNFEIALKNFFCNRFRKPQCHNWQAAKLVSV